MELNNSKTLLQRATTAYAYLNNASVIFANERSQVLRDKYNDNNIAF